MQKFIASDFYQNIGEILGKYRKNTLENNELIKSAVLIPIFQKYNQPYLLFTKRSDKVRHHKGQISFPGGAFDQSDESLEYTARRETYEELGIDLDKIHILGEIDDMITPTGFRISPFVGVIPYPCEFVINEDEVAEIIEIPFYHFMDENNLRIEKGITRVINMTYIFDYHEYTVWGATGRIIFDFIRIINM